MDPDLYNSKRYIPCKPDFSDLEDIINKYSLDGCYGDLCYVDKNNTEKIIRKWRSGDYSDGSFAKGWVPPHPTFYVKRNYYKKYGNFNVDYKIAADFDLMLRFIGGKKIKVKYLPKIIVHMRKGGISNNSLYNIFVHESSL